MALLLKTTAASPVPPATPDPMDWPPALATTALLPASTRTYSSPQGFLPHRGGLQALFTTPCPVVLLTLLVLVLQPGLLPQKGHLSCHTAVSLRIIPDLPHLAPCFFPPQQWHSRNLVLFCHPPLCPSPGASSALTTACWACGLWPYTREGHAVTEVTME